MWWSTDVELRKRSGTQSVNQKLKNLHGVNQQPGLRPLWPTIVGEGTGISKRVFLFDEYQSLRRCNIWSELNVFFYFSYSPNSVSNQSSMGKTEDAGKCGRGGRRELRGGSTCWLAQVHLRLVATQYNASKLHPNPLAHSFPPFFGLRCAPRCRTGTAATSSSGSLGRSTASRWRSGASPPSRRPRDGALTPPPSSQYDGDVTPPGGGGLIGPQG